MGIEFIEALAEKILPKDVHKIKRRLVDRLYSKLIRIRDNLTCKRCGHTHKGNSKGLHTSHYFNRRTEATRFDWNNCDSLCLACHFLWSHGSGRADYTAFKKKQLGTEKYEALAKAAKIPNKNIPFDDLKKIKEFRELLGMI